MKLSELKEKLGCLNIGYCYGPFPDNQEVPYISYNSISENPVYANGILMYCTETVEMILVTRRRDISLEHKLEHIINCCDSNYKKEFEFNRDEKIHITTYTFETESESELCRK